MLCFTRYKGTLITSQQKYYSIDFEIFSYFTQNGNGDNNDVWRIRITKNPGPSNRISTVKTIFQLVHKNTGCILQETENQLPKW